MKKGLVITIDGPAGVGKSTVSKALADKLSCLYLDTGALYRAFAYKLIAENIDLTDEDLLKKTLSRTVISLDNDDRHFRIFVDENEVTEKIRTERIALMASKASAIAAVRDALLAIQRQAASAGCIVAEGRDMGTVVFPDADVKFFLMASDRERARRRYEELLSKGETVDYNILLEDMALRDKQDRERQIAPLKAHPDALIIDSTVISVDEVVHLMVSAINKYLEKAEAGGPQHEHQ